MSKWIRVDEELPERFETVLVYATDECGDCFQTLGVLTMSLVWFELNSSDDIEVTHWQSLPEPPSKG